MNRLKVLICALALNFIWAFPLQLRAEDWTSIYAGMSEGASYGVSLARQIGSYVDFEF
jgi:hypothetical protein